MYFVALNNEKAGPFTLDQLRQMWRAGDIGPQTLFWEQGMADWQPLEHIAASLSGPEPTAISPYAPPADPPSPRVASHEPSAYDLPAAHLPPSAGPLHVRLAAPANPAVPTEPHALVAPTSLPSAGADPMAPVVPASYPPLTDPTNQVPPAAYVSLGCALGWPLLLFLHGIGTLVSLAMMVAAVVCGHSARAAIRQSGNRRPGMGIATAGMVLGYVSLGLGVLLIVISIVGVAVLVYAFSQGTHH